MKKIIVSEFVSLDGVMQAPGGAEEDTEGGFTHGGWTMPYWHDDLGAHFMQEISKADTLLLGRKTWQGHGGIRPDAGGRPVWRRNEQPAQGRRLNDVEVRRRLAQFDLDQPECGR